MVGQKFVLMEKCGYNNISKCFNGEMWLLISKVSLLTLLIWSIVVFAHLFLTSKYSGKGFNSLTTKKKMTKFSSANFQKNVKSKLYHTENSKTRVQTE